MDNKNDLGVVGLIFSGLAAIATIITLLSPIFLDKGILSNVFIDQQNIAFISFVSLIVFLLFMWQFGTIGGFILLGNINTIERMKVVAIILFGVLSIILYTAKTLYSNEGISIGVANIVQYLSYVLGMGFLGIALGQTISSSLTSYNNKLANTHRNERIIQTLLATKNIDLDCTITGIFQNPINPGLEWSYSVTYFSKNKNYTAIFYGDFTRLMSVSEDNQATSIPSPQS